ncbi:PREDICTED: uncharacterized protein LOC106813424 [Priapulus caudatus]|uniref:Uncharacterized protein LOC106813424 n=1 Tax=Priapulus caudatus TaxID=37621 RepID=A0ABM1ELH2_PRICU|nr:PREDICTED: uncharacterized protein LOC106813424 [Priapulus caudatus]
MESVPEVGRAKEVKLWSPGTELPSERALCVYWSIENDSLGFQIQVRDRPATRRGILSIVSLVYDPLGAASPFVLIAKSILQGLCKRQIGWDEEITSADLRHWNDWLSQLQGLENVTIKRCYKPQNFGNVVFCQLHSFSDASDMSLGMVFYLRLVHDSGQVQCSFPLGKARVAPLKAVTVPRMELTAAAVAVRLCKMILEQLGYSIDRTFYWTDSTSVLRYIANRNLRFHTFVTNRLAVIYEATQVDQWHCENTKHNSADCASRGMAITNFVQHFLWFNGPDFLWKAESEWPSFPQDTTMTVDYAEVKKMVNTIPTVISESCDGMERLMASFSDWSKLKRVTGWLMIDMDNLQLAVKRTR